MSRITILLALLALALGACVSSEPKVAVTEQVPAEVRQAMQAPETPAEGDDGGGGEEDGGPTVTFIARDIEYEEPSKAAPAGGLTFEIVNEGNIVHNVTMEQGDEVVVEAEGGQTDTDQITLEPGTYVYYCSIPGHREAGMEGELTVEG